MEKNKLERMNLSKYLKTKYKDVKDVDPADVDDVATAKDIASADKNIMIQLKKQIGLGNSFKVEFGDKKTARVPDKIAKAAIALYDKHKTSQQKGDYQNTISKSYKDLLSFIRKGKPVAMESVVIQEPLDPEKHDVKKYIDDFQKSTNPQFDGLSKEKRKEMAIAAYLKAKDKKEDMKNSKDKKEETLIRSVQQIMLNKDTKKEVTEAYLDYVLPKLSFNSTSEFKKAVKYFESQGLSQGYRGNEMEPAFDFNKFKDEITIFNLDELSPSINSKRGVDSFLKKGRFKYELNYIRNEGFASDAQRRAVFASGYKKKDKKKKEEVSEMMSAKEMMKMNAMKMPIRAMYMKSKKEMKTGDDDMKPMASMKMNAVTDPKKMNAMTMQDPKQDMAAGYMKSDVRAAVKDGGGDDMSKVKDKPVMQEPMKKINAMYKREKYMPVKEGSIQDTIAKMQMGEHQLVEVQEENLEKMIADYLKKGGTISKLPPALAKGMKPSEMKPHKVGAKGVIKSMKMGEVREFVTTYNSHFLTNYKAEELMAEARYEVSHDYGSRFGSYGVTLTAVVDASSPQDAMKKGHDKLETLSMSAQGKKLGVDELQDPDDEGKPLVKMTSKPITYTDMKKF